MKEHNSNSRGFLAVRRGWDMWELIEGDPQMAAILWQIGLRARYGETPSPDGIQQGEALLGDHESIGLTRQQYRSRLNRLKSAGFITIRTTNRGTIVKLSDSRLFDIYREWEKPSPSPAHQPSGNHQPTTKEQRNKDNKEYRRRDSLSSDSGGEEQKEGVWKWR